MPDPVIIDPQAIDNLRALNPGDDDQFVREIIGMFLDDTPLRIAELDQCFTSGDAKKFSRAAHSIKGSSANLGAAALRAVAAQLEERSRVEPASTLGPLLESLKAEYARAEAELRRQFPAR